MFPYFVDTCTRWAWEGFFECFCELLHFPLASYAVGVNAGSDFLSGVMQLFYTQFFPAAHQRVVLVVVRTLVAVCDPDAW